MAQKMTATQAHSALMGAGCPAEVMAAAEAKGMDFSNLWDLVQKIQNILGNVEWTKVWAIIQEFLALWPSAGSAPG